MKKLLCLILVCFASIAMITGCSSSSSNDSSESSDNETIAEELEEDAEEVTSEDDESEDVIEEDVDETADDTVYVLNYGSADGPGSDRNLYFEIPLKEMLEEKSDGRLQIDIYPSGTLCGIGNTITCLQDGTADMGVDNGTAYAGVYLYTELYGTAGLNLGTFDEVSQTLREYSERYASSEFTGVKMLAQVSSGTFTITSTKPVTSMEDLNGMSLRATSNYADWVSSMGVSPSNLPSSEVYEALRLNVIDGTITAFSAISTFNFYEVCDYITYMPMVNSDNGVFMSQSAYDRLPADLQAIIDDSVDDIYSIWADYISHSDENTMDAIMENNPDAQIIELDDNVIAEFCESGQPFIEEKVAELNDAGLDGDGAYAFLLERAK